MRSYDELAAELGINFAKVNYILNKYYPNRIDKQEKEVLTSELIQRVKELWNTGKHSAKEIAAELGTNDIKVQNILSKLYKDRPGKIESEKWSPELIQQVKDLWDSGITSPKQIAAELGISNQKVQNILLKHYKDRTGKLEQGEVPRELMPSIVSMYKNGQSLSTIIKLLGINASRSGVDHALRQLPNWEEIRAEYLTNRPTRKQNVATTDIYRQGRVGDSKGGNQFSKSPGSRHTAGWNWPKYG